MVAALNVEDMDFIKIMRSVPNAISGADLDENNYPNFFLTETKAVTNDTLMLVLDVFPVFISLTSTYSYLPGDVNMYNGVWPPSVIGGDVTYLVNFFRGITSSQPCLLDSFWCSADANGDCIILGSDVIRLVNYFRGGGIVEYCPDYEPSWPTPDDLPAEAPEEWPGCE